MFSVFPWFFLHQTHQQNLHQHFLPQGPLCNTLRLQPRKPVSFILEHASESLHSQNKTFFPILQNASTREDPVALTPLNSPLNELAAPMALGDPASFTKDDRSSQISSRKNVAFLAPSTGIPDANVIDRPILETHWPKRFPRKRRTFRTLRNLVLKIAFLHFERAALLSKLVVNQDFGGSCFPASSTMLRSSLLSRL